MRILPLWETLYYEMCFLSDSFVHFQEILNGVVEKGPMFNQEEYANIVKLLHRSDPTSSNQKLNTHLEKLADIMKKVGVAV